jgi:hypothetical protein
MGRTSAIPDREGLVYHLIEIEWFRKWKQYTWYDKLEGITTPGGSGHEGDGIIGD